MLQTDLNKLTSWAQKWKMEFNVAKCKVMHTGNVMVGARAHPFLLFSGRDSFHRMSWVGNFHWRQL